MKKLIRKRAIYDSNEIKDIVALIDYYGLKVLPIGPGQKYRTKNLALNSKDYTSLANCMLIEIKDTKLEITTQYYKYKELVKKGFAPTTWVFDLNEETDFISSGHSCFVQLQKYYKFNKITETPEVMEHLKNWYDEETGKFVCSASPIIGFNPKYDKVELKDCYEYDLNSAYSSVFMDKIPDTTSSPRYETTLKDNEIGFLLDDQLMIIEGKGKYADIIFPLINTPEPIKEFCTKYYNQKKLAKKGSSEKLEAKAMLNLPIGYMQRFNPFVRAYIVHKCNQKIKSLIDENTLFWNTDAIFTLNKREDLDIGTEIGQFKEEKIKNLRYSGNAYQINDEIPVYRGIPKQWFKSFEKTHNRPWNILTDSLPERCNVWRFDFNKLKLIKEQIYEE